MFRIFIFIWILISNLPSAHATEDVSGPGESFSLGFYSNIHNNIDTTVAILRKKEIKKYSTFSGFGSHCRGKNQALDGERMDEDLLIEVSYGNTSRLINTITKNNGVINADSLMNLSSCLAETYRKLGEQARIDENSLSQMGVLGLYTDGDTKNSDYDILSDIEKINSILFSEKLDYKGDKNTTKSSYDALTRGETIPNILEGMSGVTLSGGIIVSSGSIGSNTSGITSSIMPSLGDLGVGSICSVSSSSSAIGGSSVANMVDDAFLEDLSSVLGGYNPGGLGTKSYNYGNTLSAKNGLSLGGGTKGDFFNTPPCSGNFCIKIKTVNGGGNPLAGGKTYSIESLIDKHSKIIEPIANSNLSAQKHQKNSFQLPFLNVKFKNQISGAQISLESSPQLQKKYQEEYTQSMQDQEFEYLQRCAYISAGLAGDRERANIPSGVGYQFLSTHTTDNTIGAKKTLGVINPDDSSIAANCMTIALGKPREEYYSSLNTDLTELEVFTTALISQISRSIEVDKKLDTLRTK